MYRYDDEIAPHVEGLPRRDLRELKATRAALDAAAAAAAAQVDPAGVAVEEQEIRDGPRVRVYRPDRPVDGGGVILHAHGGGFVMCSVETSHARSVELVRETGLPLVSVEYRLAPEHPYPAAVDDVYAALEWLAGKGVDELGADPGRIALHGVSAGAGLVAGVALLARDRGGPRPRFQFLNIPVLDDRQRSASIRAFTDTPGWDTTKSALSWDAYLERGVPGGADVEPYAAPARATDLRDLPPAYVSVMEFDPLRDEGIAYASALLAAGVPTELHVFPGTFHGSTAMLSSRIGDRERAEEVEVLRAAVGSGG
ncbi:alpha/beta hydrolase [Pseudonocardia xishanensis]|uniref:Alpha/beta hydrolase n=1 Tax=Pseudonocardia xishanensis TaxID=630995 RepID=A0ABP8RQE0_9PSEU